MNLRFAICDLRLNGDQVGARAFQSQIANRKLKIGGYSFAEVLFAVAVLGIGFIMIAGIFPAAILQTQAAMEETVGTATARNGLAYLRGSQFLTTQAFLAYSASGVAPVGDPGNPPAAPGAVFSLNDPRCGPAAPGFGPATAKDGQTLWDSVKKGLIVANDPRFAIVPLYSRDSGANFAKLIIFSVRVRDRERFIDANTFPNDIDRKPASNAVAELEPRPVRVLTFEGGTTGPDLIQISNITTNDDDVSGDPMAQLSAGSNSLAAAAEGAYVVISNDRVLNVTGNAVNEEGRLNGRIYQLGAERAAPGAGIREFELVIGGDMSSNPGADNNYGTPDDVSENIPPRPVGQPVGGNPRWAIAFLIGRGYSDPNAPGNYSGPVRVVQKYENVIPLN